MRLFGEVGRATESTRDIKLIFLIQIVRNRTLSKYFSSAAFYSTVQENNHKYLAEAQSIDADMTRMINDTDFTVAVANLVRNEVEKGSIVKSKMK